MRWNNGMIALAIALGLAQLPFAVREAITRAENDNVIRRKNARAKKAIATGRVSQAQNKRRGMRKK